MGYEENKIEGRNAVLEAFRSGKTIDKLFVLDGCQDGPVRTIVREAKKHDTIINFVDKERLDGLSETKKHQGVIAMAAAYEYAEVDDILKLAEEKGEPPFIFLLDNIHLYGKYLEPLPRIVEHMTPDITIYHDIIQTRLVSKIVSTNRALQFLDSIYYKCERVKSRGKPSLGEASLLLFTS